MSLTLSRHWQDASEVLAAARLDDDWGLLARVTMVDLSNIWQRASVRRRGGSEPLMVRATETRAALLYAELHLSPAAWLVLTLNGMAVPRRPETRGMTTLGQPF